MSATAASAAPVQESTPNKVQNILVSQGQPAVRTAYDEIEKRFGVHIDFVPFVTVEGLTEKEYRKNRVYPNDKGAILPLYSELGTLAAKAVTNFDFTRVNGALVPRPQLAPSPALSPAP